ncbi:MAG: acyl-CoA dehydrogenase [Alphaproteobacteria bacterium]|nr:acyl-CoA dehydrogenase [Alphaproteobacteria bacterium]
MDFHLTDEQRILVGSLQAFLEDEIYPHEAEVDRSGEVPAELGEQITRRAIEMGFYAANLPESVGGGGLDNTSLALFERVLGTCSHALHGYIGRPTELLLACEGDQVERYLRPCVRGDLRECFALSEPGAGSDIMSMTTRAVRDGGDFVINGSKHFISCVGVPDFAIVFAATSVEDTPKGERKRATAFLVDRGTKGFALEPGYDCISIRGYNNYRLTFDDCRVGSGQILGEVDNGLDLAETWLKMGRVWVGATCCGKAERLINLATEWAATRKQFGQPIGKFQGTSFKLADMATELRAADLLVMNTAWKADQGVMEPADAAMVKLYGSEMLGRVADNAVQIFGGMGLMSELPIERMWRDSRLERIWDGTSEIQRHIIARSMLRPLGG